MLIVGRGLGIVEHCKVRDNSAGGQLPEGLWRCTESKGVKMVFQGVGSPGFLLLPTVHLYKKGQSFLEQGTKPLSAPNELSGV